MLSPDSPEDLEESQPRGLCKNATRPTAIGQMPNMLLVVLDNISLSW